MHLRFMRAGAQVIETATYGSHNKFACTRILIHSAFVSSGIRLRIARTRSLAVPTAQTPSA